ncbi:MAG: PHP domain-containing protein, partial [Candidatus Eisenbacteria bacterium]|nr:PHP domain-containing protein [Candidatus Eisenbacteria bacterium]
MLRALAADLHVHTCLSPCASLDMAPGRIVARARALGLAMIAITDHNSVENAGAVARAARGSGLCILPGMEVTTAEEAHIVALFEELPAAESLQELVYARLQPGE